VVDPATLAALVVPGLVFDRRGYRLGWGKGYYDRTLPLCGDALRVSVAFEHQVVDDVSPMSHDLPVHWIATEIAYAPRRARRACSRNSEDMTIVILIAVAIVGAGLGWWLGRKGATAAAPAATDESIAKLRSAAEAEAAEIRRSAELAGQELAAKRKTELDDELRQRKGELAKREEALGQRERDLERQRKDHERRAGDLDKRERSAEGKAKQVDAALEKAEAAQAAAKARLEEVAGLSADAARARLEDAVRGQAQAAAAAEIKRITDEAERESQARPRPSSRPRSSATPRSSSTSARWRS
jgi:hypothetical protein